MDGLLIATGFTGALTLVWLTRRAAALLWAPPSVSAQAGGDGCVEAVVREINAARKEVLFQAQGLACRPVAQALIDARLRRASVEVVIGPGAGSEDDLSFLREQGLLPRVSDHPLGPPLVLIDGRTVLAATSPSVTGGGEEEPGRMFIIKGHAEAVTACRLLFPRPEGPPAAPDMPAASVTPAPPDPARPAMASGSRPVPVTQAPP